MHGRSMRAALAALVLGAGGAAWPQEPLKVEEMVEQLKPSRTRSLRNLIVEPAQPPATAGVPGGGPSHAAAPVPPVDARPSLSLLVQFDFDSARVRPESVPVLQNLAAALKTPELADSRFLVEGHTDAKGRAEYNLRLSQRRADAVKHLLVSQGVAPRRLTAQGRGASEPANAADPEAGENRRVRVVNLD